MVNWSDAVNFEQAKKNIRLEYPGDWYRDPWTWPEIDWLVDREPQRIIERLDSQESSTPAKVDVAKENFSIRPAVVLDPLDRLAYQCLIDRFSLDLIGDLDRRVYGWRLPVKDPERGKYSPASKEWRAYADKLKDRSLNFSSALTTDIASFFASVSIERLVEKIQDRVSDDITKRLALFLTWYSTRVTGRSGLPQRSTASSVLANLYLRPLDDILRQYTGDGSSWYYNTPKSLRWMDDIWLFSNDEGLLRNAQVALQKGMNDLDLNMNSAKTDVLVGDDLVEAGAKIQHSAVDADLAGPATGEPLAALVDRLLTNPEKAPRTSVRFATKRMRDHDIYSHVDGFVTVTERMPHASDALARLFRDAGYSSELEEWYIEYLASSWHAIDWSAAQLGTMFPSSKRPGKRIVELFADLLADPSTLVMTALLAQRVAAWDADSARAAIRAAVDRTHHPLIRRVLALGAIGAGEERDLIRRWLNEFAETSLTLAMLEDRGWKVPVAKDFAGNGPT